MSGCYYNDSDPFVCAWLRNLIAAGHLPAGEVDERPIQEVQPDDVRGFTQCHFFAGIGGWALALRLGGWPAERPVWTGSCPCQDLSAAGKQRGAEGERHLWPEWYRLIAECHPPTVFGEQVASKLGRYWLTAVRLDLEGLGFAVGAADLCAAGVGAPHIRQRIWFVGESDRARWPFRTRLSRNDGATHSQATGETVVEASAICRMDDAAGPRCDSAGQGPEGEARDETRLCRPECGCATSELADASQRGTPEHARTEHQGRSQSRLVGPWSDCDWLPCRDGKARPVEPGTFPLAHGIPARVGRLRAYGNAINPYTAAAFVSAYLEIERK